MDSFLSLFDPTEDCDDREASAVDNDNVKIKVTKGRRRNRKGIGKNATLPEESSFLCEPDLSSDVVKTDSYIDSFIEVAKPAVAESKSNDRKQKKRVTLRKTRRRRSKVTPVKDPVTSNSWCDQEHSLNNCTNTVRSCNRNIGKNVNILRDNDQYRARSSTPIDNRSESTDKKQTNKLYNVIDKLDKRIESDVFPTYNITDELDCDMFYSSDECPDSCDDSSSESELEDSCEEVYGSLPPEPRFGNVEYKLQLVAPCEKRFQHLVTQLKWRLASGGGAAVYVVGVRDGGAARGLRASSLRRSLSTLRRMAAALAARVASVTARRLAPRRALAEVHIEKLADTLLSVELRVAVLGANEAGKSTIIGVLTQGELDNGRGSARLNMFRHLHEVKSGRTSSLSHEILGFDTEGNVVNYGCSELMTAERIGERSAKLVSFLDLAGHSKYQRTTLHGLTGYSPHYAMLVISATAGITPITEEHLGLLLALDLPFFVVITKCELVSGGVRVIIEHLATLLGAHGKRPLLISDENSARDCVGSSTSLLESIDTLDNTDDLQIIDNKSSGDWSDVPVFAVSCVKGAGLNVLHAFLLALQPPTVDVEAKHEQDRCEFQIDEIFHVGGTTGPVVGGLLARGVLHEGDDLLIGPLDTGAFAEVSVRTIYRNRARCGAVRAGHSASLGLSRASPPPRPGMVLLAIPDQYRGGRRARPTFGGCAPGACKRKNGTVASACIAEETSKTKDRADARRKNKNLLRQLSVVERSLSKTSDGAEGNLYRGDSDEKETGIHRCGECERDGDMKRGMSRSFECERDGDMQWDVFNRVKCERDGDMKRGVSRSVGCERDGDMQWDVSNRIKCERDGDIKCEKRKEMLALDACASETADAVSPAKEGDGECACRDAVQLEDPNDPRGCVYFQASVKVLRHSTTIGPGFQCSVHVGNVRQTAIIEGIMSRDSVLRVGETGSVVFRFVRCPEYLVRGRRMLFTAGLGTRAIGRITQTFPYIP